MWEIIRFHLTLHRRGWAECAVALMLFKSPFTAAYDQWHVAATQQPVDLHGLLMENTINCFPVRVVFQSWGCSGTSCCSTVRITFQSHTVHNFSKSSLFFFYFTWSCLLCVCVYVCRGRGSGGWVHTCSHCLASLRKWRIDQRKIRSTSARMIDSSSHTQRLGEGGG